MAFVFNGTTIGTLAGNLRMNGVNCTKAYMNGALVWEVAASPGSIFISTATTWTVPTGIYKIEVCMAGGGGGGATTDDRAAGGGHKGAGLYNSGLAVTPGQVLKIEPGAAGAGASQVAYTVGGAGGTTYLRNNANLAILMSAAGGAGGTLDSAATGNLPRTCSWQGDGATTATCDGVYADGIASDTTGRYMGGGQYGLFGNGTNGASNANAATGSGAGGGAASKHVPGGAGNGGSGGILIAWPGF